MARKLLSAHEEKIAIESVCQKPLVENDTWFIIDANFWNCWKEYVGWNSEVKDSERPTQINNDLLVEETNEAATNLFTAKDEVLYLLKKDIAEGRDFIIVNTATFKLFKQWYELSGPELPRKVIKVGAKSKLLVEIHPVQILVFVDKPQNASFHFYFSRSTCVADLKQQIISCLRLSSVQVSDWQVWSLFNGNKENRLDESGNLQLTLDEAGVDGNSQLLFQKMNPSEISSKENKILTTRNGNIYIKREGTPAGFAGLMNLGNTCFLNAAIQGLSNTPQLRQYFLSGKYRDEINLTNPIGTKGEIAESFSALIGDLWAGDIQYIVPKEFKRKLGKHAPQFSGFEQHDSQEVLSYMLDAIHEDLNRVKDKPFVEIEDCSSHENEYEEAKKFWNRHKTRNDSIVVDLFQGQFKSTIQCPDCKRISITFDPLMYLSLPVPLDSCSKIQITFISSSITCFWFMLKATDTIVTLKLQVKSFLESKNILVEPNNLLVTEVTNSRFHKFLNDASTLDDVHPDHKIAIYEISEDYLPTPISMLLPCIQAVVSPKKFKDTKTQPSIHETFDFIGFPVLLPLQRVTACQSIYNQIWTKLQQITKSADLGGESEYPFTLYLMNRNGSLCRILDVEGASLSLQNGQYLVIEWDIKVYRDKSINKAQVTTIENTLQKPTETAISLDDCLDHFTKTERLGENDKWFCSRCKDHKQATKKMELFSLPKFLIVHLKRFSFVNVLWRDKISLPIHFPLTNWDVSAKVRVTKHDPSRQFVYDLYSVTNHFGSTLGGHYTNTSYNESLKQWVVYDDQKCSTVSQEGVFSENAYLLFYKIRAAD